jgi:2'-5' RNA ligase
MKTYTSAVVIIPPARLWPPITLIYPFRPREEFEALTLHFSRVCRDIDPFEVELAKFCFTEHSRRSYTLWLVPELQEKLILLQSVLLSLVPDCDDLIRRYGRFIPHLSVAQAPGKMEMLKLQGMLQENWQPLSFTVCEVSFIWRGGPPDDVFRVIKKIGLGKQVVVDTEHTNH